MAAAFSLCKHSEPITVDVRSIVCFNLSAQSHEVWYDLGVSAICTFVMKNHRWFLALCIILNLSMSPMRSVLSHSPFALSLSNPIPRFFSFSLVSMLKRQEKGFSTKFSVIKIRTMFERLRNSQPNIYSKLFSHLNAKLYEKYLWSSTTSAWWI